MKEKFDYQTLFDLVRKEADLLKMNASEDELCKLDINNLYNTKTKCIYGQMTGNCLSKRASELIKTCCERVYDSVEDDSTIIIVDYKLNGSPVEKKDRQDDFGPIPYFSPIETMISLIDPATALALSFDPLRSDNTRNLIDYLKGKTDELILTEKGMELY